MLIYSTGFLLWYSATTLGLYPVLDGREHLELARRIASGELPQEPFYRAPLYAAALSWLIKAGVTPASLPFAARAVNGVLHLFSTTLVGLISARLWRSHVAAAISALLFGMNPVVLHFAADPLDLTFAVSLLLGALNCLLRAGLPAAAHRRGWLIAGALLLAAAVLARPQMLPLLPVFVICAGWPQPRHWPLDLAAMLMPMALVLGAMGLVNEQLGGVFRILPWQSAYNLWAANGPGANGRYFVQTRRIAVYADGTNPARIESERQYRADNPGAPDDWASMSRYWNARTLAAVRTAPQRWLRLESEKLWYLLNNFEQYDIKTYHVHKAASPWLRWNPLGWTVLLTVAAGALGSRRPSPAVATVGWFVLAYGGGLLLGYVNARFRLPLVPLLAILGGGVAWRPPPIALLRGAALALPLALMSLLPLPAGEADKTLVQDELLHGRAAVMLGFNDEALVAARAALERSPGNEAARELLCVAAFNAWLHGAQASADFPGAPCADAAPFAPGARRVVGIGYWRQGRVAAARAQWQALVTDGGSERDAALAALLMTGQIGPHDEVLKRAQGAHRDDVLVLALAATGDDQALAELARRMNAADASRQLRELRRTFSGTQR